MKNYFEYEIFIPMASNETIPILKNIKSGLIKTFGGMTDSEFVFNGSWRGEEKLEKDVVRIWKILSDLGMDGDEKIQKTKAELETLLNQHEILVLKSRVEKF